MSSPDGTAPPDRPDGTATNQADPAIEDLVHSDAGPAPEFGGIAAEHAEHEAAQQSTEVMTESGVETAEATPATAHSDRELALGPVCFGSGCAVAAWSSASPSKCGAGPAGSPITRSSIWMPAAASSGDAPVGRSGGAVPSGLLIDGAPSA